MKERKESSSSDKIKVITQKTCFYVNEVNSQNLKPDIHTIWSHIYHTGLQYDLNTFCLYFFHSFLLSSPSVGLTSLWLTRLNAYMQSRVFLVLAINAKCV